MIFHSFFKWHFDSSIEINVFQIAMHKLISSIWLSGVERNNNRKYRKENFVFKKENEKLIFNKNNKEINKEKSMNEIFCIRRKEILIWRWKKLCKYLKSWDSTTENKTTHIFLKSVFGKFNINFPTVIDDPTDKHRNLLTIV